MSEGIAYRTEASAILRDGIDTKNAIALQWVKGGTKLKVCSGPKDVSITPGQLEQLVKLGPAILKDLQPQADKANVTLAGLAAKVGYP